MLNRERGGSSMTALRFHFINDRDRESVIAFVFAEQRRTLSARAGSRF